MRKLIKTILYIMLISFVLVGCGSKNKDGKDKETKDNKGKADLPWLKNAVIYEVNLRQFSASGNFKGFTAHLDSLKMLGADVLWFMPLQTIGVKNRKGSLGSYYSIKDYKAINPEFGTEDDFRLLVEKCHEKGFKIILDWVGNHTSWDNNLMTEHPDWYTKDNAGKIIQPVADWTDVADLNYDKKELREYMIDAMKWWLDEFDLDGFHCDAANMVPTDFWEEATSELTKMKKVLMIAEAEQPNMMQKAFHACYGWEFNNILKEIYKGNGNADSIVNYFDRTSKNYPADAMKMHFVANYEENAIGGAKELFGESEDAITALTFTINGLPLIYNGMEAGVNTSLKFFDKDAIKWNNPNAGVRFEFYKTLVSIRHKNPALWTNVDGQTNTRIFEKYKDVYGFIRQSGENKVLVVANLSNKTIQMDSREIAGLEKYDLRLYKNMKTDGVFLYELGPWGYSVSTLNEPEGGRK